MGFPEVTQAKSSSVLVIGKKGIVLHREENTPKQSIGVLVLTKVGIELSKLIDQKTNINYIEKICSKLKCPTVKIEYGDIVQISSNEFQIFNSIKYS